MTLAIDVAILLPDAIRSTVERINQQLDPTGEGGIRLDTRHHPHVTLSQHFVAKETFTQVWTQVGQVVSATEPFEVAVTGLRSGRSTQVLVVAPCPPLQTLHTAVMDVLMSYEVSGGDATAFQPDDRPVRPADVTWVSSFRTASAYERYAPHITVGTGSGSVEIAPFRFEAHEIAICRLGPFCTCQERLASWFLQHPE